MNVITIDNHPPNIAVFRADSMREAVVQAEEVLEIPNVQGALWIDKGVTLNLENDITLKKNFMTAMNLREISAITIPVEIEQFGSIKPATKKIINPNFIKCLSADRVTSLTELSEVFEKVRLQVRHQSKVTYDRHSDARTDVPSPAREDKPFNGRRIRILENRRQASTIVYLDGNKNSQPWRLPFNAPLFFTGEDWSKEKALWHATPTYTASSVIDTRAVLLPTIKRK